jgi:hypothetical protein
MMMLIRQKGDDAYEGTTPRGRAARGAERVGIESTPRTSCRSPHKAYCTPTSLGVKGGE